jgi:hypothetical protein
LLIPVLNDGGAAAAHKSKQEAVKSEEIMKSDQWKTYRTRFLVNAKQLTSALSFTDHLGRQHSGRKGDYLVESCDGVLSIAPRQIFEDIYVPITGADAISGERPADTPFSISDLPNQPLAPVRLDTLPVDVVVDAITGGKCPRRRRADQPQFASPRRKSPQPVRTPHLSPHIGLM